MEYYSPTLKIHEWKILNLLKRDEYKIKEIEATWIILVFNVVDNFGLLKLHSLYEMEKTLGIWAGMQMEPLLIVCSFELWFAYSQGL